MAAAVPRRMRDGHRLRGRCRGMIVTSVPLRNFFGHLVK